MRQIFFDHPLEAFSVEHVEGERFHHLARVLGMKNGQKLIVGGPDGHRYEAHVRGVEGDRMTLSLGKALPDLPRGPSLRLLVAPPKGKAWDQVLDIATRLGVDEIQPVQTRRTVVRWEAGAFESKAARFEKILMEAAAQCNRPGPPVLKAPVEFDKAVTQEGKAQVFAYELSENSAEPELDRLLARKPSAVDLWIGPEGGFDPDEVMAIRGAGAIEVSLGPALLRVPVAVAALITRVQAAWERQSHD